MAVKGSAIEAAFSAMERLVDRNPRVAETVLLTDRNLATESGVSRATLARSSLIMDRWRSLKYQSAKAAFDDLSAQAKISSVELTDADLISLARIDSAAFIRMPAEFLEKWEEIKLSGKARKTELARGDRDRKLRSLLAKLYALTCAVRQRDKTIKELESKLEKLQVIQEGGKGI